MRRDDDHLDLLMELVSMPHWRAVKFEVAEVERGLIARLCQPITSLPELVIKEGNACRLAALRQFVNDVEQTAERCAKQLRESAPD